MTTHERTIVTEYLLKGNEGDWVEYEGRTVEITCMCGGRYLFFDEDEEVAGQTDNELSCVKFLEREYLKGGSRYV